MKATPTPESANTANETVIHRRERTGDRAICVLAYLAIIAVVVVWVLLYSTTWGLRVRSVGEHPQAADTVGISVRGVRWSAVLAGGVLAGLLGG